MPTATTSNLDQNSGVLEPRRHFLICWADLRPLVGAVFSPGGQKNRLDCGPGLRYPGVCVCVCGPVDCPASPLASWDRLQLSQRNTRQTIGWILPSSKPSQCSQCASCGADSVPHKSALLSTLPAALSQFDKN